jgi:hypothetical protein
MQCPLLPQKKIALDVKKDWWCDQSSNLWLLSFSLCRCDGSIVTFMKDNTLWWEGWGSFPKSGPRLGRDPHWGCPPSEGVIPCHKVILKVIFIRNMTLVFGVLAHLCFWAVHKVHQSITPQNQGWTPPKWSL